jgi:hypothetical protein
VPGGGPRHQLRARRLLCRESKGAACARMAARPVGSAGRAFADGEQVLAVRKVLGWPKRDKLARAFLWGYSNKRLKLAQLLGQRGAGP